MTSFFGLKFVVSAVGLGVLDEIAGKLTGILSNVGGIASGFDNVKNSMVGFGQLMAGGALTSIPLMLFKSAISAGMDMQSMMTQLMVANGQNKDAAKQTYYELGKAVDWLPQSTEQVMRAYSELKLFGIDALKSLGTYTTKLGDTTQKIPVTLLTLASSLSVQTRRPFESVIYGLQAAMRGNTRIMLNLLGPAGREITRVLGQGGQKGFDELYKYMAQKGLVGLAIEQSKTLAGYWVGFKDMLKKTFTAIAGFDDDGLFQTMTRSLENAYATLKNLFDDNKRLEAFGKAVGNALMPIVRVLQFIAEKLVDGIVMAFDAIIAHPLLAKAAVWAPFILGLSVIGTLANLMWVLATTMATFWLHSKLVSWVWSGLVKLFPSMSGLIGMLKSLLSTTAAYVLIFVGVLEGLWAVFNWKAFSEGFKEGFGIVFRYFGIMSGWIRSFASQLGAAADYMNGWVSWLQEILGVSGDVYDFWKGLGALIGGAVAVAFGAIYVVAQGILFVFQAVWAIVKTIVAAVKTVTAFAAAIGIMSNPFGSEGAQSARTLPENNISQEKYRQNIAGINQARQTSVGTVNITVPITGKGVTSEEVSNFAYGLAKEGSEIFSGEYALGMGTI